jgi:hypothetical protein
MNQQGESAKRSRDGELDFDTTDRHVTQGEGLSMNMGYNGLLGLLILAGDIWAIINIFQSSATNGKKLVWILIVLLLPLLGLLLWFFVGPRDGRT